MSVYDEADLYAAAFDWPVDDEVDWLLATVGPVASVLEPFCGHARFAPAFVARHVRYVGVDRSLAMLARVPRRDGVIVVAADARDFEAPGAPFDLAWCPVNSVTHLVDEPAALAHLACVRRHLRTGGAYVIEIEFVDHDGPWPGAGHDKGHWSMPGPDGTTVVAAWRRISCDRAARTGLEHARFELRSPDGTVRRVVDEQYVMRTWSWSDTQRLAAASGFAIESVHDHRSTGRLPVDPGPHLENDGVNRYVVLRAL